jgi:hypothetical protein
MAATDKVVAISHTTRLGLVSTPILEGPEAASQTFKQGAVLVDSAGKVAEASNDPTASILGIALHDASGTTDQTVMFVPALPHVVFEATLEDQATGDHALVQTNCWQDYGLKKTAAGLWYIDENDGTGPALIIRLVDPAGTIQGRVQFQFKSSATIWT